MGSTTLADLIVVVHLGYVLFVILMQLALPLGTWCRWTWVRRRRLRIVHLVFAWIPAVEAMVGVVCPLTEWENALRDRANQSGEELGFIARLVSEVLFYDAPQWVFSVGYVVFALLVTASWWWIRPQPRD